jgi:hypothetical protein
MNFFCKSSLAGNPTQELVEEQELPKAIVKLLAGRYVSYTVKNRIGLYLLETVPNTRFAFIPETRYKIPYFDNHF